MLSLKLPAISKVTDYLAQQGSLAYTYTGIGATRSAQPVKGFDNDYLKTALGHGPAAFEAAKTAICGWQMFPAGWTIILPEGIPTEENRVVAMYARAFGFWWRNACRIVYTVDEPGRFGFAYGTLPGHIESGEELFCVSIDAEGGVWYEIRAFSRPRHWLARLSYPLMRFFQARFRRDSAAQMQQWVQQKLSA